MYNTKITNSTIRSQNVAQKFDTPTFFILFCDKYYFVYDLNKNAYYSLFSTKCSSHTYMLVTDLHASFILTTLEKIHDTRWVR